MSKLTDWIVDIYLWHIRRHAENLKAMQDIKDEYDTKLWLLKHKGGSNE